MNITPASAIRRITLRRIALSGLLAFAGAVSAQSASTFPVTDAAAPDNTATSSTATNATNATTPNTTAAPPSSKASATPADAILLTVFLRHDQSRPLSELNAQLARQGFYKAFPPQGMEVVSWYVAMGIGQVITLRLPASRIREVNRVLEDTAWGAYRTEFYPTYDYKAVGMAEHDKAQ